MTTGLPRILSPNLGCPLILSHDELNFKGFDVVIAAGAGSPPGHLSLIAHPSFPGEGTEFPLELKDPEELTEETLPPEFKSIEETRFLISTTLRFSIFAGQARFFVYRAKPTLPVGSEMFRKIGQDLRATLYDLSLIGEGRKTGTVSHSLCLRPHRDGLRFIHLTDLHVALRNDLYADHLGENIPFPACPKTSQEPPQTPVPNVAMDTLEATLTKKVADLQEKIQRSDNIDELNKLTTALNQMLDSLEKVKRMKKS